MKRASARTANPASAAKVSSRDGSIGGFMGAVCRRARAGSQSPGTLPRPGSIREAAGLRQDVSILVIEPDNHRPAADFAVIVPLRRQLVRRRRRDAEFLKTCRADDGDHEENTECRAGAKRRQASRGFRKRANEKCRMAEGAGTHSLLPSNCLMSSTVAGLSRGRLLIRRVTASFVFLSPAPMIFGASYPPSSTFLAG